MFKFRFQGVKYAALAAGILLTACTNDVAGPSAPDNPDGGSGIPDNFEWKSTSERQLTVNVVDEYAGKFNYTIEVYDADPVLHPDADLLVGAKIDPTVPYRVKITVPAACNTLYILQTDPMKRRSLFMCDVTEGDLSYDLGVSNDVSVKSAVYADNDADRVDFSFDRAKAVIVTGNADVALEKNKTYVIRGKFKGALKNLTEANHVSVYVEGEWQISQSSVILQNNINLYVLDGGKIAASGNCRIQCNNSALIAVQGNGEIDGDIDISLYHGGAQIVNEGEMEIRSLYMESSAQVTNFCVLDVEGKINAPSGGAKITLKPGAMVECGSLAGGNLKIDMDVASVFKVEKDDDNSDATGEANFNQWNNQVTGPKIKNGTSNDFALFLADRITSGVTFSENVEWFAKSYSSDGIKVFKPARMAVGKPNVDIDDDECNRYSGNHNPGEGTGDTDDSYESEQGATYTYLFEDNWPALGDYDMNDLVMDITISNRTVKGNATAVTLTTKVRAVGATKPLYAFAQIEAPGAGRMLVPLFDGEVHRLMGAEPTQMINTSVFTCKPVVVTKTHELPGGTQGIVNADNLNVFIVWGDLDAKKWNEVHLPGYEGTARAAGAVTSKAYKYKFNPNDENSDPAMENMMWGLMIPAKDFKWYPLESVSIMKGYGEFENWAKSGGTAHADWYRNPTDESKLYR